MIINVEMICIFFVLLILVVEMVELKVAGERFNKNLFIF